MLAKSLSAVGTLEYPLPSRLRQHGSAVALLTIWSLLGSQSLNPQTTRLRYQPTESSLAQHPVPQWYKDAKLGIFVHWGLYSVPAWAPVDDAVYHFEDPEWFRLNPYAEWYLNTMRVPGSPTAAYHRAHYGTADYYAFSKQFNREIKRWDPRQWASLFTRAGARYVVLTTKHHDGFTLWPSAVSNPHLVGERAHATRDLVGDLSRALAKTTLRMGVYYSGGFDWTFKDGPFLSQTEAGAGTPDSDAYARYVDAQYRELIARYHPAILWNDIRYPSKANPNQLFADFYNEQPDGVVNDRWSPATHSDLTTPEYQHLAEISPTKWEECRGLADSFGYNRAEGSQQTLSAKQLVHLLIDVVSKNGNLLLDVGPRADGSIPALQRRRLLELGSWLGRNGRAIYETEPWIRAEGKTEDGTELRFTRSGDVLFAILLERPREKRITIPHLTLGTIEQVTLLGSRQKILWHQDGQYLRITFPDAVPNSFAYAFAIKASPAPESAK